MLVVTALGVPGRGPTPAAAEEAAGAPRVVQPRGSAAAGQPLTEGGSATAFGLALPEGAACTGDSAGGNYRVQSYMVPASVSPASLTFDSMGPVPQGTGADFRQPLYDTTRKPYVNALTDIATAPGGPGTISQIPAFSLAVFADAPDLTGPQIIPPGSYNLGIACTHGPAGPDQLDRFWNIRFDVAADPADRPLGLRWTVAEAQAVAPTVTLAADPPDEAPLGATVTLTATLVPSGAAGTVTFTVGEDPIGEPVPVADGTATLALSDLPEGEHLLGASFRPTSADAFLPAAATALPYRIVADPEDPADPTDPPPTEPPGEVPAGDPPPTAAPISEVLPGTGGPEQAIGGGIPTGPSVAASLVELPRTGGSVTSFVVWSVLLVIFGRMAVLLGRTPEIRPLKCE
jgi:hypothetical protein